MNKFLWLPTVLSGKYLDDKPWQGTEPIFQYLKLAFEITVV